MRTITLQDDEADELERILDAILVTMVGNTSLTTSRNFPISRKLGKTHQNVLVFVKGDGKRATQECGPVEIVMPEGSDAI